MEQRDFAKVLDEIFTPGARLYDMVKSLAARLGNLMDIDWAAIGVIDREEGRVHLFPLSEDVISHIDLQTSIPLSGSPADWVADNRCAAAESDLSSKSSRFSTGPALLRQGINSAVYMPLFSQGQVYGSFMVGSRRPQAYKERELTLLRQAAIKLATPVAIEMKVIPPIPQVPSETEAPLPPTLSIDTAAMEAEASFSQLMLEAQKRAEEYFSTYLEEGKHQAEETKETATAHFAKLIRESQEEIRQQLLVRELASIIASGDSLPQALQSFADRLSAHLRFDCIIFATPHGEGVRIEWSSGQASPRTGEVYPARDCATPWMAEHKTIHIEEDLSQGRQFPIDDLYQAQGRKSIIRVPLFHGRTFLGTLEFASRQAKAFGEEQQKFLELLSSQLGLPLEKLRLRSGERERMEFLAALVHEVKTPLTSIISSSKLLQEEIAASEPEQLTPRLIDNVLQSAERMERRISHFFELAVLRNAIYELTTEITDIKPMLQELILRVAPSAQSKGQDMVTELSDTLPWVKIDKRRMDQVVLTLLHNAIAFNPQGGTVTLRAKEEGGRLIVQVGDSGPGFSPQEQEEMFKPYYPAEADRQRSPELRLGLAVARELVELHGGTLWMESELGKGSTFAFSLPISPDS